MFKAFFVVPYCFPYPRKRNNSCRFEMSQGVKIKDGGDRKASKEGINKIASRETY
jgi:hypothetical protein